MGTAGVTVPPITIGNQKPAEVNFCKSVKRCEADHIKPMAKNLFLPFPWSEKFFFTISIFDEAALDE